MCQFLKTGGKVFHNFVYFGVFLPSDGQVGNHCSEGDCQSTIEGGYASATGNRIVADDFMNKFFDSEFC